MKAQMVNKILSWNYVIELSPCVDEAFDAASIFSWKE